MTTQTRPDLGSVPGWFPVADQMLFTWTLERQAAEGVTGDLLELGCYLGKSAILVGRHVRDGETFTVCDLFEGSAPDEANSKENRGSYASLTRTAFEENYRMFHPELPVVVQGPTSVIGEHVAPASCRFVHIDASHLYAHVHGDIKAAQSLVTSGGIVVCDDYRSEHTPGVAAAVWEAVADGFRPICVTSQKLYGVWGDPAPVQAALQEWLGDQKNLWHEVQEVAGGPLLRIKSRHDGAKALRDELAAAKASLAAERERRAHVQSLLAAKRAQLSRVRGSRSFKVARALGAPTRLLRRTPDGPQ